VNINDDGSQDDLDEEDLNSEGEKNSPKDPIPSFGLSPAFFEQLHASSKAFETFQKQMTLRNEAVMKAFQNSSLVNQRILESLTAATRQSNALTQWAKHVSNMQNPLISQQFKGMERVLAGLKGWQEQARKLAASLPKFDTSGLDWIRDAYPPNWSKLVDSQVVDEVLYKDGIPIVWVPPSQILDKVLQAPDRVSRMTALMEEQDLIVEDCERVINECVHPDLSGQLPLAISVLHAWKEHPEAAQALAVNLTDSLIKKFPDQILPSKEYQKIKETVKVDLGSVLFVQVRVWYALAAIYVFFTTYYASSGPALPKELSRHASTHTVHIDHFHRENALIAIMLMTSIMRTLQEVS
jgi:hypothetical protein